jgi:hypothetical protein
VRIGIVTEEWDAGSGAVREAVAGFAREARRLGHSVRIVTGAAHGRRDPEDLAEDVVRIGASRTLLRNGVLARVLSPRDPGAWARALVRLSREPIRAAAYGERGRMAAQRHAWPQVAREVIGLYRALGVRG